MRHHSHGLNEASLNLLVGVRQSMGDWKHMTWVAVEVLELEVVRQSLVQ